MQFSRAAAAALELMLSRFWIRRQSGSVGIMQNCQTLLPASYCRNHMTAQLAACWVMLSVGSGVQISSL